MLVHRSGSYFIQWTSRKHKTFVLHLYDVGRWDDIVQMLPKCFLFAGLRATELSLRRRLIFSNKKYNACGGSKNRMKNGKVILDTMQLLPFSFHKKPYTGVQCLHENVSSYEAYITIHSILPGDSERTKKTNKQAKRNKTKQNKTKQNKTKQNKTKQNKTKQNKTKQNKTK